MNRFILLSLVFLAAVTAHSQAPSLAQLARAIDNPERVPIQPVASRLENDTIGVSHVLAENGKLPEAIKKLEAARIKNRSPHYDHTLATFYRDAGETSKAIELLKDSTERYPNFGASHYLLGILILSNGGPNYETAAKALFAAYQNGHRSPNDLKFLGQSFFSLERFPEAEYCFRKYLSLKPDDQPVRAFLVHALQSQGKTREAAAESR